MKLNKKLVTALIVLSILLSATITCYVVAQTPTSTIYFSSGIYPSQPTYTVWREENNYFAKNRFGQLRYSGTNFTTLFSSVIGDMPSYGGIIHLKTGLYVGSITINRDGIILQGEGSYNDVPSGIPDNSPTELYGSVLRITETNDTAITITGQRYGVQIRDLGIWFNVSATGDGISATNTNYSLTHSTIENIKVLNCDADSYAINLHNFLHCSVNRIMCWGGSMLNLFANTDSFHAGNSIFDSMYCYVKYDLDVTLSEGVYPIFIHKNDSLTDNYINLLNMRRIQVNNPTTQTDSDYYTFCAFNLRYSTISNLDLEGVNNNTVRLGSCYHVTFDTAYLWTSDPGDSYVNVASSNTYVTWVNSELEDVLDSHQTNRYVNCKVNEDIIAGTIAFFDGLEGNSGNATFTSGQTSITVTATYLNAKSMILLTIIDSDALTSGEALKVSSINTGTNQFVVQCIDELSISATTTFFWVVLYDPT